MMLPIKKTVFAIRMMGFRPKMPERVPQQGIDAALTRRYADPIQA
jgi:hypothetical protein